MDPDPPPAPAEAEAALEEIKRLSHHLQSEAMSGAEIDAVHANLRRAILLLRSGSAAQRRGPRGPGPTLD